MIPADGTALDLAVRRLERAMGQLEQRLAAKAAQAERTPAPVVLSAAPGLFDDDERLRLVADLAAAHEREKALEEAGEQASVALGRAIAEIRAALGDEAVANDDHAHDGHAVSPTQDEDLFDDPEEA
jgi:Na+-transporting methylmalonyl-CoA/oxaloacetate decarboxylase gamma subunit